MMKALTAVSCFRSCLLASMKLTTLSFSYSDNIVGGLYVSVSLLKSDDFKFFGDETYLLITRCIGCRGDFVQPGFRVCSLYLSDPGPETVR